MNIELIKDIASVVGCISAIIALAVVLSKPIRCVIQNYISRKIGDDKLNKQRENIIDKMNCFEKKVDLMIQQNEDIIDSVEKLKKRVTDNEQDRLRSELYTCGNRCRRGIGLYPEEYSHISDVYKKYTDIGGNHGAHLEFDFICQYYNNQSLTKQN